MMARHMDVAAAFGSILMACSQHTSSQKCSGMVSNANQKVHNTRKPYQRKTK